jgi:hypothetical protein
LPETRYNFLDRLLHRLALQYGAIAEMSFDLDQKMVRTDPAEIRNRRHVFVSGLARAGTTVLMRKFHDTGRYRSLTYRDMPFVLAPNFWRRISGMSKRDAENVERAHGDKLVVNIDSPESLDEVFWRIFSGKEYILEGRLLPYQPDKETILKYVCYVNAVLSAHTLSGNRYLSKNNNNILRLDAIHHAFPNALVLIPFREPLQHASSLLRQHMRFLDLQSCSEFTLSYMTWLGHHEFGLDHRPILPAAVSVPQHPIDTLNYWLELWCDTYSWLENSKPAAALFVCYEDLCKRAEVWQQLAELADIPADTEGKDPIKSGNRPVDAGADEGLVNRANATYERLLILTRV